MNQSSNETHGLNFSSAPSEQLSPNNVSKESGVQSTETRPSAPEQNAQPAVPPLVTIPPAPTNTTQDQAQANSTTDVVATTKTSSPKIIEDSDLIEKEWVDKAKKIVERNRDDPYKQSEELTEVRADYMKKVYNKTIKIDK